MLALATSVARLVPLLAVLLLTGCPTEPAAEPPTPEPTPDPPWRSVLYPEEWTPELTDESGRFLHDFSYAGYQLGELPLPGLPEPTANVLDFGADPEGQTDSTEAIQGAIDSLAGGGTVLLPEGLYRCDGLLRVQTSGLVAAATRC